MRRVLGISLAWLLLIAGDAQALAGGSGAVDANRASAPASAFAADKVTLEQAVRRVRKQYGGRIISAETRGAGDNRVHVIKVLTDAGRVQTVRIRAN